MLKIIFNSSNNDYSKGNIDTDKATEHIAKITQDNKQNKK